MQFLFKNKILPMGRAGGLVKALKFLFANFAREERGTLNLSLVELIGSIEWRVLHSTLSIKMRDFNS